MAKRWVTKATVKNTPRLVRFLEAYFGSEKIELVQSGAEILVEVDGKVSAQSRVLQIGYDFFKFEVFE